MATFLKFEFKVKNFGTSYSPCSKRFRKTRKGIENVCLQVSNNHGKIHFKHMNNHPQKHRQLAEVISSGFVGGEGWVGGQGVVQDRLTGVLIALRRRKLALGESELGQLRQPWRDQQHGGCEGGRSSWR